MQAREDAKARKGADFDLKEFHRQALDLGSLGLDRFDCSGLVLASYRSAGYKGLPRVAKDQYYATNSTTLELQLLEMVIAVSCVCV